MCIVLNYAGTHTLTFVSIETGLFTKQNAKTTDDKLADFYIWHLSN